MWRTLILDSYGEVSTKLKRPAHKGIGTAFREWIEETLAMQANDPQLRSMDNDNWWETVCDAISRLDHQDEACPSADLIEAITLRIQSPRNKTNVESYNANAESLPAMSRNHTEMHNIPAMSRTEMHNIYALRLPGNMNTFVNLMTHSLSMRTLFRTISGLLGVCFQSYQKGDEVWLLKRGKVPYVLRPNMDGETYSFMGDCYVHGIMNGELMTDDLEEEFGCIRITKSKRQLLNAHVKRLHKIAQTQDNVTLPLFDPRQPFVVHYVN